MTLTILVFLPLASGLLQAFMPKQLAKWFSASAAVGVLIYSILLLIDYPHSGGGLKWVVDETWIHELGIHYSLGVDGLSLFMILLTTLLWAPATIAAALREWDSPRLFFFNLALAQTAVLGAFTAQDVALFVFFFDLMLVPFYFLIGTWGGPRRVQATTKFVIYTLVGSLLMLAAAVALGVLSAKGGQPLSFDLKDLTQRTLSGGDQEWIFVLFAAAFLVKMPAFPIHGWMPDAYRAAPLPVLILLSGVLSKVGAYGFLRVVLPLFPTATSHFQELVMLIALASILYGSVMAFTPKNIRLIAGYSSVAQLGFITLGIFSLRPDGADGAVLQMVNHGLVVAPLMLIAVLLVARTGTDDITRMGGLATRAPVLAALFLVATMALLAIPGSANFIGEFYILNGVFQTKIVYAFVAAVGIALAAYYALRLYQQAMHNRTREGIESREIGLLDGTVIAGLVACIVALALWPGLILHRADRAVSAQASPVQQAPTQVAER